MAKTTKALDRQRESGDYSGSLFVTKELMACVRLTGDAVDVFENLRAAVALEEGKPRVNNGRVLRRALRALGTQIVNEDVDVRDAKAAVREATANLRDALAKLDAATEE